MNADLENGAVSKFLNAVVEKHGCLHNLAAQLKFQTKVKSVEVVPSRRKE